MARRFLTALDVRKSGEREIVVDEDTIVTPQALDVARSMGIALRTARGTYSAPAPDRGPDALRAQTHLPHLPEPEAQASEGTGVVVTVVGRNRSGVLAEITARIAQLNVNIDDISQKMVDRYFHLVLLVTIPPGGAFDDLKSALECSGDEDYAVRVMHERVFRFMHRI